jgi:hypothetical protein
MPPSYPHELQQLGHGGGTTVNGVSAELGSFTVTGH